MEHRIILELMALHSSTQNGLAEQAIHTIMEDTHALLSDSGLADHYWAEAGIDVDLYSQPCTLQLSPWQGTC